MMQVMRARSIVLASGSPRRRELLEAAGLRCVIDPPNVEEDMGNSMSPRELVKKLALKKAAAVALRHKNAIIIGADTVVAIGRKKWSKPENLRQAAMMLHALNGKTHDVWTAFCIIDTASGKRVVRADKASVTFRKLSRRAIAAYLKTGEPLDAAGGYKIQETGNILISDIRGDYNTIIGLPLALLFSELRRFGVSS
jgi:septum formation protein